MKKYILVTLVALVGLAAAEDGAEVGVDVEQDCQLSIYSFEQPGDGEEDPTVIAQGNTGYFSGTFSNTGNANTSVNATINLYEFEEDGNITERNVSENIVNSDFRFDLPYYNIDENRTQFLDFMSEFEASYDPGLYLGEVSANYTCSNETFNVNRSRPFEIIEAEGEDDDDTGDDEEDEGDDDADFELDMDAIIEALNETAEFDANLSELENATLEFDAEEIDQDADPRPGDDDFPGETEVPEPEPEPDPVPLLSVSILPNQTIFDAQRETFTELGLEIENIGVEPINDLELEPRFGELEGWNSQQAEIGNLEVGESVNTSVFIEPEESVQPGLYEIPVFASSGEDDIGMEHLNIQVLDDVFDGVLEIVEAPRDVTLEQDSNYSLPLLLRNAGNETIDEVEIELDNHEECVDVGRPVVEDIGPGDTGSATLEAETGSDLTECSAMIVATSDEGDVAYSEMDIEIVEEVGIVPPEFRVPIVASLWTVLLVAYAVLYRKLNLETPFVKAPMVLLVMGQTFIVLYLSSNYYNLVPPGLLPFT